MAQVRREQVVEEALRLLDEVGLDRVTTRALAERLGVKQPSLYWHFKNKDELLAAMAEAAMAPHSRFPLPSPGDDWKQWFMANHESFRRTLLLRRDGARLHAGSRPAGAGRQRTEAKVDFLVGAGLPRRTAELAMLTASRFTVGSVLEQQAEEPPSPGARTSTAAFIDHDEAFQAGMRFIISGLERALDASATVSAAATTSPDRPPST